MQRSLDVLHASRLQRCVSLPPSFPGQWVPFMNSSTDTTKSATTATERRTYTVQEAAKILGISRSTAYACARSGELPVIRFRRRLVVPSAAIGALLDRS